MNPGVPFSLSDILERVIPGTILLVMVGLALQPLATLSESVLSGPLLWFAFLAGAYASGVMLNTLSVFFRKQGSRKYWMDEPDELQKAMKSAIRHHFKIEPDNRAWSVCYGTCLKHGYGANTQLFNGLEVFCRSMMMSLILASIALLLRIAIAGLNSSSVDWIAIGCLGAGASLVPVFRIGAFNYDRAFIGSIYEGFYSWYCEQKP